MTDDRKSELRKLCEAATPGPWVKLFYTDGREQQVIMSKHADGGAGFHIGEMHNKRDRSLVIASRAALPELLDALDAAQARAESLAGQVGEMRNGLHAHLSEDCEQCRRLLAQPPSALEAKYAAAIALAENCDDRKNGYTVEWLERHEELLAHYRAAKEAGNV